VYTDKVYATSFYANKYYFFDGTPFNTNPSINQTFISNGAQTTFTLSNTASVTDLLVSIDGLIQPTSGYLINSGNILTFDTVVPAGSIVEARTLTTTTPLITNTLTSLAVTGQTAITVDGPTAVTFQAAGAMSISTNNISKIITLYSDGGWGTGSSGSLSGTNDVFTGDGSRTSFTISTAYINANDAIVTVDSVIQTPNTAYTLVANTVTFTEAPLSGSSIEIRSFTTGSLYNGSNVASFSANVAYLSNIISSVYTTGVSVGTSATTIDQFETTKYRTSKYIISTTNGSEHQASEVMVVHDGTTTNTVTYGTIYTGASQLVSFSSTISSGNVLFQGTSSSGTSTVKIQKTYIGI
jgi:hypothetical protein